MFLVLMLRLPTEDLPTAFPPPQANPPPALSPPRAREQLNLLFVSVIRSPSYAALVCLKVTSYVASSLLEGERKRMV